MRLLPSNTYTVTNTASDAATTGSLAWAVGQVNGDGTDSTSSPDIINFNIAGAGVHTIQMATAAGLTVNQPVVINGYSQSGTVANTDATSDNAVIKIALTAAGSPSSGVQYGLLLESSNSTVKGLDFQGFSFAVTVDGSTDIIAGNFIGTDPTGMTSAETGPYGYTGLEIRAANTTVGGAAPADRNLISGIAGSVANTGAGVIITSSSNTIEGNLIGLDASGGGTLSNENGIEVLGGSGNQIGNGSAGNVISKNVNDGILISGAVNTVVSSNLIGTDGFQNFSYPNLVGVEIDSASAGTEVGGTTASAANVISGNTNSGVYLHDPGTSLNTVIGNVIGTDSQERFRIANEIGIEIAGGATGNTVGGSSSNAANIIMGNIDGVVIKDAATSGNFVLGNFIGCDRAGLFPVQSYGDAIDFINAGANTVGGTTPGDGNVLSGNNDDGIFILQSDGVVIEGNLIGTDPTGTVSVRNLRSGIIEVGSTNLTIGGVNVLNPNGTIQTLVGNVISGNGGFAATDGGDGIVFESDNNAATRIVEGNLIGTNLAGTAPIPNLTYGILGEAPVGLTIGGSVAGSGNLISGNTNGGILLEDYQGNFPSNATILGNRIGTTYDGTAAMTAAVPNAFGIEISHSSGDTIGQGDCAILGNLR